MPPLVRTGSLEPTVPTYMTASPLQKQRDRATAASPDGPDPLASPIVPETTPRLPASTLFLHSPIAGRYAIRKRLGRGGHGEVWEADDLLAGMVVAVKLLDCGAGVEPARVRREVAALRLLRLPGVVRMIDEGL